MIKKSVDITLENSDIEAYLSETNNGNQFSVRLHNSIHSLLEKISGFYFKAVIPDSLEPYDPKSWDYVKYIHMLAKRGITNGPFLVPRHLRPDEPPVYQVVVESNDSISKDSKVATGSGVDFFSADIALAKAFGEYIERESLLKFTPTDSIPLSLNDITSNEIFSPFDLAGIDNPRRESLGENFKLEQTDTFDCIKTDEITTSQKVWLPSQLFTFNPPQGEKLIRPVISTGAATHPNIDEATLTGIYELIERDAFMLSWYKKIHHAPIQIDSIPSAKLQTILKKIKSYHLETYIFDITNDFKIPTILAVIKDESGCLPRISVGAATHHSAEIALEKAIIESLTTRLYSRDLADKDHSATQQNTVIDPTTVDQSGRQKYWFQKAKLDKFDFLLQNKPIPWTDTKAARYHRDTENLNNILKIFRNKNYALFRAHMNLDKFNFTKLSTIMLLAPNLQPLHLNESYSYLSGKRFDDVEDIYPNSKIEITKKGEYFKEPHPFP